MNWYAYVGNNPVVWIDPEGLHLTDSTWHNLRHWNCTWKPGLKQGAAIVADTAIPFADPFANRGAYNPNDPFAQASGTMASIGLAAGETAAGIWAAESAGALRFPEHVGGVEMSFGRNFRVGWHRFTTKAGRVPNRLHYHRRPGIGWHRPWEKW